MNNKLKLINQKNNKLLAGANPKGIKLLDNSLESNFGNPAETEGIKINEIRKYKYY